MGLHQGLESIQEVVDLSIVIVSWNTRDLLAQCLDSIGAHAPQGEMEVFVVDNASTDNSAAMVRERFPRVRLIENQENVGFARANNQAIRESTGRYVLLLNPDTRVHPGALQTLLRFMDDHPQAGAAGARLLNLDGTLQLSCQPRPTLFREAWMLWRLDDLLRLGSYDMSKWDVTAPRKVDVVKGACLSVRREALFGVGLLDGDYFLYAEELDLCERIRRVDYDVYWVPQAVVTHFGGQSTGQMPESMFFELYLSKYRFFLKHYGWAGGLCFKAVLLIAALPRIALGLLAYLWPEPKRTEWLTKARLYRRLAHAVLSVQFDGAVEQTQSRALPVSKESWQ